MISEGRFGIEEGIALIGITIITKSFYVGPTLLAQVVGTASWYMVIISTAAALIIFALIYLLLKKFPDKNIMEIYNIVLGPVIGFIFSLILFAGLIFEAAVYAREFVDVLKVYTLPLSPPGFLIGLLLTGVITISFLGLESLARFSRLFFYTLAACLIAVVLLSTQNFNISRIFPIFGYGLGNTIYHGIVGVGIFREIVIITIFAKSLQGIEHVKKVGFISLILAGATMTFLNLTVALTFPYEVVQELTSPLYEIAALIEYGRFFQRLESIFIFVWSLCTLISISVLFYCSLLIYCDIFKIEDKKPIIMPMIIIFFTLSILPQSFVVINEQLVPLLLNYSWIVFYVPIVITLIISKFRKSREGNESA